MGKCDVPASSQVSQTGSRVTTLSERKQMWPSRSMSTASAPRPCATARAHSTRGAVVGDRPASLPVTAVARCSNAAGSRKPATARPHARSASSRTLRLSRRDAQAAHTSDRRPDGSS